MKVPVESIELLSHYPSLYFKLSESGRSRLDYQSALTGPL